MEQNSKEEDLFVYPDNVATKHKKVPSWLIWIYASLPIWGVLWWIFFWNGSNGWLDRGYWKELQKAANTTFPTINVDDFTKNP